MIWGLRRSLGRWVVAWVLSLLLLGGAAYGSGFADWENEFGASFSGSAFAIDGSSTIFHGGYYSEGLSSIASFGENGLGMEGTIYFPLPNSTNGTVNFAAYDQGDLVMDWPVGTWGVLGNATFSMHTNALTQLSITANVTAYGTSTTAAFSLAASSGGYTPGLTLELTGTTLAGFGITATSSFSAPEGSSCGFCFTGATIRLDAFPWGCVHPDVDFVFASAGFEKVSIDFDVSLWDDLITFDGTLEFSLQTKTLTLTPRLNLGGGECFWVSVGIDPQAIGSEASSTIDRLVLSGGGLGDIELGSVTLDTISSFCGNLFRSAKSSDIDLHSSGYYVALAPDANPGAYVQTDYDTVITLQEETASFSDGFSSSRLTLDFYFGSSGTTLFGFALFTAEWQREVSEAFTYRIAAQLDPAGVKSRIEFGFTATTTLP